MARNYLKALAMVARARKVVLGLVNWCLRGARNQTAPQRVSINKNPLRRLRDLVKNWLSAKPPPSIAKRWSTDIAYDGAAMPELKSPVADVLFNGRQKKVSLVKLNRIKREPKVLQGKEDRPDEVVETGKRWIWFERLRGYRTIIDEGVPWQ